MTLKIVLSALYLFVVFASFLSFRPLVSFFTGPSAGAGGVFVSMLVIFKMLIPFILLASVILGWKVDTAWFWLGAPFVLFYFGQHLLIFLH